ncbi:flagellar biosynthetic protein FliR [Anaeroselena agilis]|uniref:Flagellar biosynthetic protein FliR n=1 Tax=Anaeroselena agilis TaxID=3063788 RepID=A0ABU3NYG3_9FIRM|nr:flagellar biosynthetic protein FliR [Selenomonadales bacterium 4137-cl]
MDIVAVLLNQTSFFLLIFARISGIFSVTPFLGSTNIPVYAKAGLSMMLSYILFPAVYSAATVIPDTVFGYAALVAGEFLLGLIFGFVSSLIMQAVQMAGHVLDMQIGFGMVNVFDPQFGQQIPLLGNFKYILALMVFLATNGHHVVLSALVASFKLVPVTGVVIPASLAGFILDLVSGAFTIAFKISVPVLASLLLTEVAFGILARTMPQMNIFVVGIPAKLIIGTFALMMALPFYVAMMEVGFNGMYQDLYRFLSAVR